MLSRFKCRLERDNMLKCRELLRGVYMNSLSKKILESYQVRKNKKQKLAFIEFIKENFPQATVEEGGFIKCRNIVIGDPEKAKVIFSAHYDTCAQLPFPNLIFPRNFFFSFLYSFLICIPVFAVMFAFNLLLDIFISDFYIHYFSSLILFFLVFIGMFIVGIPNKHTANDNTSGVISVLELYERLSPEDREKCAFVLFDHEESGLFGSGYFKKRHREVSKNTLLINLDCVGDGENLMLVMPKKAMEYTDSLNESFSLSNDTDMNLTVYSSSTTFYPSDQTHFAKGIGVAALHKKKFWGYYMGRIHTNRDVICEDRNISYVTEGFSNFVEKL